MDNKITAREKELIEEIEKLKAEKELAAEALFATAATLRSMSETLRLMRTSLAEKITAQSGEEK